MMKSESNVGGCKERIVMNDWQRNLKKRTKDFALRIIRLYCSLPKTPDAHYREALRARSTAEFISKLGGGLQELEETGYWLELLVESNRVREYKINPLLTETNELIAMFTASVKTAKNRKN